MGFHPGGRGRAIVETYQAAAESTATSSPDRTIPGTALGGVCRGVRAMSAGSRQSLCHRCRTCVSHRAFGRCARGDGSGRRPRRIAGVIASSAGFADSRPRASVPFAVFGTAGTEDFNYIEMRLLDRKLTSPHRLAVFAGGHTLPPATVALDAIEWMELQAMKSGRRSPGPCLDRKLYDKRQRLVAAVGQSGRGRPPPRSARGGLSALRDVSAEAARKDALSKESEVKRALQRERADDDEEARLLGDIFQLEADLGDPERRLQALGRLRANLSRWARDAAGPESPARSRARRALRTVTAGAERVQDPEYRKLLEQYPADGTLTTRPGLDP